MSKKRVTVVLIALVVVIWNAAVYYVDMQLEKRSHEDVYASCHKVWSSRGLYSSRDERNSITSFKRAFEHAAQGVEVDFHYDVKMKRFIVGHDHPKPDADGNLVYPTKEGQLLTLEVLFEAVGDGYYFWLDYKNLDKLSTKETDEAIIRLQQISQNGELDERLYIEGSNPLKISRYTEAGFKTILGVHPLPETHLLSGITRSAYKLAYHFSNATALAMPYAKRAKAIYGNVAQDDFGSIPVFLFHVTDEEELLRKLVQQQEVRVILAGRDKSIDRFGINSCQE